MYFPLNIGAFVNFLYGFFKPFNNSIVSKEKLVNRYL